MTNSDVISQSSGIKSLIIKALEIEEWDVSIDVETSQNIQKALLSGHYKVRTPSSTQKTLSQFLSENRAGYKISIEIWKQYFLDLQQV